MNVRQLKTGDSFLDRGQVAVVLSAIVNRYDRTVLVTYRYVHNRRIRQARFPETESVIMAYDEPEADG